MGSLEMTCSEARIPGCSGCFKRAGQGLLYKRLYVVVISLRLGCATDSITIVLIPIMPRSEIDDRLHKPAVYTT